VRFTPELSDGGRAPGGASFAVPFHVDEYGRTTPPSVIEPSIEVSYDDGASWRRAPVAADASGWVAHLEHPRGTGYVSLRTSTQDMDGNAVEQTLYRAYGLESDPENELESALAVSARLPARRPPRRPRRSRPMHGPRRDAAAP
jgi:hypothetical protein